MKDKQYIAAHERERQITYDDVAHWLKYDKVTGAITWKNKRGQRGKVGSIAGCVCGNGYVNIRLFDLLFLAQRIAWLLHYKSWPSGLVDHIDGNGLNNAIANLRLTTNRRNTLNKKIHRQGRLFGVRKCRARWSTSFRHEGVRYHLGVYDSEKEAHEIYKFVLNSRDRTAAIREIRQRLPKAASSNYRSMKL